jgi:integrase
LDRALLGQTAHQHQGRVWQGQKKAGITRRIRLYDIRHLHISYALGTGADIMDLAERVGHVNAAMIINVYAHLAKDLQKNKPHALPSLHQND